jgi:hypothetical protein
LKLSDDEVQKARKAVESVEVAGQRYPPAMVDACFADTN